ncbi:M23 family metallopeptidase [Dietzia sp. PP-33]|jgi:hypothetical protein|uniref:M23 family metallopeptidase n=1 Tax=Dietzia sp. PP-33 TaxID=2957500 RepID=UPI0029B98040|nr:M23 family metallopeptidase [Dietzia sp. PP-33]MDX2357452.1 M23 family metallopeptidase [Dietzia sp. PP-33]
MAPIYWPLERGHIITSGYGPRWGTVHYGTDFGWPGGSAGKPVYACQGGTVVARAYDPGGFGWYLDIDSPTADAADLYLYGHITPEVNVGQRVEAGQRIGHINGNRSTNGGVDPHVHVERHNYVRRPPGPGRKDPMPYWRGALFPPRGAPVPTPTPSKGPPVQPSTTYTQLTSIDRGPRDPQTVPLIALHTYECPRESGERALRNRADYQETSGTGSYTVLVAADGESLRANDDNYTPCASLHTGDRLGFHLSFLAYASDSRETWLKHDDQLREAARICAQWCRNHGHEVRRLSVPEVQGRRVRGFCSHGDISAAFRESTHTDPGPHFPWDVFLRYVTEELNPASAPEEDDMFTDEDRKKLDRVHHELTYLFESRYEDPDTGE